MIVPGRHLPKIGIIGAGIVGSATGKGFAKLGHKVLFYDTANTKLSLLMKEGFDVTHNIEQILSETDISFICVGTPTNNGRQDLSQLHSVTTSLAIGLSSIKKYHLVVYRSTLLPGSIRNHVLKYLDSNCSMKRGSDYDVCYNPEFLRQATPLDDFLRADRIVIGEDVAGSSKPLSEIYQPVTNKILITNFEAAEMIKYTSNCFLALKISFFNEIGILCNKLGIDSKEVGYGVSLDKRIGSYGTKVGMPFGGACLPKDSEALASFIQDLHIEPDLVRVALSINKKMEEIQSFKDLIVQNVDTPAQSSLKDSDGSQHGFLTKGVRKI